MDAKDMLELDQRMSQKLEQKQYIMIDYESIYVQIMHELRESGLCDSMSDAAVQAERITEIVKENVEEELSNGTE